jgi:hypothetical protein
MNLVRLQRILQVVFALSLTLAVTVVLARAQAPARLVDQIAHAK